MIKINISYETPMERYKLQKAVDFIAKLIPIKNIKQVEKKDTYKHIYITSKE